MAIHEMTQKECADFLSHASLGRIACALDNQPYVIPIYFAYEPDFLYALSTFGQKIEWMRANPKVCLEVDEVADQSGWTSVVVSGLYQELIEPEFREQRKHARKLLEKRYHWWQNALGERQAKAGDALIEPLFFRIRIESVTGLRAASDSAKTR